jgi:thiol:disulfide interchange protein DsbC
MYRSLLALAVLVPAAVAPTLSHAAGAEDLVRAAVAKLAPGAKIDAVAPSPIAGVYEVIIDGSLVYVPADGKYLISGDVWQVDGRKNLSEQRRAGLHKTALHGFGDDKRIIYPASGPEKHKVTVFTDIDCGYCRKLHQDITAYNKAGITVEYMFFPRAGISSDSYNKIVSVWCAADRNDALTKAKGGADPEMKTCPNPVAEEFELGRKLGVAGTPAIFAEDGSQIGGYLTVDQMVSRLDAIKP